MEDPRIGKPVHADQPAHSDQNDLRLPSDMTSQAVIDKLNLKPGFQGGFFGTYQAQLFCLLTAESYVPWHRRDSNSMWMWKAGAPCILSISENGHDAHAVRLSDNGMDRLEHCLAANHWVSLVSHGYWTLLCLYNPDASAGDSTAKLADPEFAPDDWFPRPRASQT